MAKTLFLLVDTETTIQDHVVDFGALVCDRKGNIRHSCRALVKDFWGKEELFYDVTAKDTIWSKKGLERRKENYKAMINNGDRAVYSVAAINKWLMQIVATYKTLPILTAYNIAFDWHKCANSGINLEPWVDRKFCLWHTAAATWGHSTQFRQFILDGHYFNAPTRHGNMSYKTNAEVMARFILNNPAMDDEPHTAYEDARDYERPILVKLAEKLTEDRLLHDAERKGYNWKDYQVNQHFKPK